MRQAWIPIAGLAHCPRAVGPALASDGGAGGGLGGLGCAWAVPAAAGRENGCCGSGSGQIGSTAACAPDGAEWTAGGAGGLPAGLCVRREDADAPDCGFGLAAAAAATPGSTGPDGSGFMMLTAGIDAALGKSMLTILRGLGGVAWAATGAAVWTGGASATTGSAALAQISR